MSKKHKVALAAAALLVLFVAVLLIDARGTGSAFVDVDPDAWYADAVEWAAAEGITNGTAPGYFSPDKVCTRAEMVTFLHRLAESMKAEEPEPMETEEPTTFADRPRDPYMPPEPTIIPEYQNDYYGRMTFYENFDRYSGNEIFSIGLYETLDGEMVDLDDTAFIMERGGCYAVGDHNYPSFWLIRYAGPGDVLEIRKKNGGYERYKYMFTDRHVRNAGNDFLFDNAESCFFAGADLFLATCNDDGGGKYVTAVFWRRIM